MNEELRFTSSIRQALDESTERLPWRVTQRLEQARKAALARLPEPAAQAVPRFEPAQWETNGGYVATAGGPYLAATPGLRLMGPPGASVPDFAPSGSRRPSRLARGLAAVLLPLAILVAGFAVFSELASLRTIDESADLELAVLMDEVPIAAYADRGFGVYLQNATQSEQ